MITKLDLNKAHLINGNLKEYSSNLLEQQQTRQEFEVQILDDQASFPFHNQKENLVLLKPEDFMKKPVFSHIDSSLELGKKADTNESRKPNLKKMQQHEDHDNTLTSLKLKGSQGLYIVFNRLSF